MYCEGICCQAKRNCIAHRHDKFTVTTLPHFGHFISMIPLAGVTLSKIRQSQTGQRLDTFNDDVSVFMISPLFIS